MIAEGYLHFVFTYVFVGQEQYVHTADVFAKDAESAKWSFGGMMVNAPEVRDSVDSGERARLTFSQTFLYYSLRRVQQFYFCLMNSWNSALNLVRLDSKNRFLAESTFHQRRMVNV